MDRARLAASIRGRGELSFSRSGGPGGQNVNKVNTKVTLRLPLAALEGLSPEEAEQLRRVLSSRITAGGELLIHASEERSQEHNRECAFLRAEALIAAAARLPRRRRPSRPSRASREKRLRAKRLVAARKAARNEDFFPE